ncbi:hypothetical protein KDN24_06180 [Bacillus sp. Bva_UNVM-123]|uniref:hypothetical protein n=1 Tax=Bacillus sp. Bva_UNVM-123 TaxID=2829798 RepID=UPI00391F614F
MGMYQNIRDILDVVWNDEDLNRLLYYKPEDESTNVLDPLSPTLPNILDIDEDWKIRNDTIMITPKDDDLTNKVKCRLFVYLGNRRPLGGSRSFQTVNQELIIDVLCHADFENGDMRSNRIGDRLNELFSLNNITGLGKMDYGGGRIISRVPSQYAGYQHTYEFGGTKR